MIIKIESKDTAEVFALIRRLEEHAEVEEMIDTGDADTVIREAYDAGFKAGFEACKSQVKTRLAL